jgi:hypothetical protein
MAGKNGEKRETVEIAWAPLAPLTTRYASASNETNIMRSVLAFHEKRIKSMLLQRRHLSTLPAVKDV